jgi:hypothetical protein
LLLAFFTKTVTVTLGLLMLSSSLACATKAGSPDDVPLFSLPAWKDLGLKYGDQLMLRLESRAGGALLLKHSRSEIIYKYDRDAKNLTQVNIVRWTSAGTAIAECGKESYPGSTAMRIDTLSHQFFAGNRAVPTAGRTVLKFSPAPSGKWVAVLSASGDPATSLLPFTGGSGASGEYYHQVMSLPEAKSFNPAMRLPLQHKLDSLTPCWSSDEQYVVYHQVTFNYLSIVPTKLSIFSEKVPK